MTTPTWRAWLDAQNGVRLPAFHEPGARTAAWLAWEPYGREAETAVHEAGHAVMAYTLNIQFRSTSIIPDTESRGRIAATHPVFVADLPPEEQVRVRARKYRGMTPPRMIDHLLMRVAGAVAEQLIFERVPWEEALSGSDASEALRYAAALWPADIDIARAYIEFSRVRARKILGTTLMRDAINVLARELLERRTLSRRRVGAILRAANVPRVPRGDRPPRQRRTRRPSRLAVTR